MTLVVLADESEDFQALGETIAALMPEHPARTIIVRVRAAAELAARVFAQCWMPFGQRRQICCEQIEITAAEADLGNALALVDAIAAPDLPVISWSRRMRFLRELSGISSRVVVDSGREPDPQAAVQQLAQLATQGVRLGDLSWTRLTRWREMISQSFESAERLARLRGPIEARVEFGGTAAPVAARYLAAWLADSLRSAGASARVTLESAATAKPGGVRRVKLAGADWALEAREGDGRLTIEADALAHCVSIPPGSDDSLLREELGIVRADPVFERTLRSAKDL